MPFAVTLNTSSITAGEHTLQAVFKASNGYSVTKTYTLTKAADGTVSFAQK